MFSQQRQFSLKKIKMNLCKSNMVEKIEHRVNLKNGVERLYMSAKRKGNLATRVNPMSRSCVQSSTIDRDFYPCRSHYLLV